MHTRAHSLSGKQGRIYWKQSWKVTTGVTKMRLSSAQLLYGKLLYIKTSQCRRKESKKERKKEEKLVAGEKKQDENQGTRKHREVARRVLQTNLSGKKINANVSWQDKSSVSGKTKRQDTETEDQKIINFQCLSPGHFLSICLSTVLLLSVFSLQMWRETLWCSRGNCTEPKLLSKHPTDPKINTE